MAPRKSQEGHESSPSGHALNIGDEELLRRLRDGAQGREWADSLEASTFLKAFRGICNQYLTDSERDELRPSEIKAVIDMARRPALRLRKLLPEFDEAMAGLLRDEPSGKSFPDPPSQVASELDSSLRRFIAALDDAQVRVDAARPGQSRRACRLLAELLANLIDEVGLPVNRSRAGPVYILFKLAQQVTDRVTTNDPHNWVNGAVSNHKMRRASESPKATCHFCEAECDDEAWCYGCEHYICESCDEMSPIGPHTAAEHKESHDD